jgi:hypothetical protein
VDIVFPALESVIAIGLWGNISRFVGLLIQGYVLNRISISMPKLETTTLPVNASGGDFPFGTGIVVQTFGNPLDVNLSKLSNADNIKLEGTISR